MSHEGIRFVNKEEQARENLADRPLAREAVTSAKVQAKATNTVALWPGQPTSVAAYRNDIRCHCA